jgi:hypothetical protein
LDLSKSVHVLVVVLHCRTLSKRRKARLVR